MSKIAFIYPGQGAQYVGMAKDFYDSFLSTKAVFEKAKAVSGLDMEALCFTENEEINITEYTQIAMVAAEIAMTEAVLDRGVKPDVTAGLSLGEYAALYACGGLSAEDALRVVRKRGIFMQKAVPQGGSMVAVLGLDAPKVEVACEKAAKETGKVVSVANYNCPGQIVITGEEEGTKVAIEELTREGAKRCIPLKVSGPFHSSLLENAGKQLGEVLDTVTIHDLKVPYVANVNADYNQDRNAVKELLIQQVSSSVRWQQSVEKMVQDGVDVFIEIGPGKTLSGFMRKIAPGVQVMNIEKVSDLDKLKEIAHAE